MSVREADILYELGEHWVCRTPGGAVMVYRTTCTHSILRSTIGPYAEPGRALDKAKADCARREALRLGQCSRAEHELSEAQWRYAQGGHR